VARSNEGGDRGRPRSEHQITLPVAGHLPGVGLGRSLVNGDYVPDLTATVRGLLAAGRRIVGRLLLIGDVAQHVPVLVLRPRHPEMHADAPVQDLHLGLRIRVALDAS